MLDGSTLKQLTFHQPLLNSTWLGMWVHSMLTSKSGEVIFLCSTGEDREVRRFVEFTQGSKQVHGWNWIPGLLTHCLETWRTCPCAWLIPVLVWTQRTKVSHPPRLNVEHPRGICDCLVGSALPALPEGEWGRSHRAPNCALTPEPSHQTDHPQGGHLSTQRCSVIDFTAIWTVFQHILMETDILLNNPGCAQALPPGHMCRSALLRPTLFQGQFQTAGCRQSSHPLGAENKEGQCSPHVWRWHLVPSASKQTPYYKPGSVTGTVSCWG